MMATAALLADVRAAVGECPTWSPEDNRIIWIDIPRGTILATDPSTGRSERFAFGAPIGAIALRSAGGYIVASGRGCWTLTALGAQAVVFADTGNSLPCVHLNDGKVDPDGGFVVGESCGEQQAMRGRLYRFDVTGERHVLMQGVTMSNGLDWSPSGREFYYVDTASGGVDVFSVAAEGQLRDRRRLVSVSREEGLPDGLCVDAEGCLWLSIWGAGIVRRYTPDGKPIAEVRVPVARVSSCAFGGPGLRDLFITTASVRSPTGGEPEEIAGGLFAVQTDTCGQEPRRFAG